MYGQTASTNIMPPGGAPQRVPQITERLSELNSSTEILHQALSELDARLSPILGPGGPSATEGSSNKPMDNAPLAGGLREMNQRVQHAIARIAELTRRIEV